MFYRRFTLTNEINLWIVDEATTIAKGYSGTLESPDTIGTFSNAFDLATFGSSKNLSAIHYVGSTINMSGVGITSMTLDPGDLILSVDGGTTVGGLPVAKGDLFVFQPTTQGNYGSGSFTMLAANIGAGKEITAVTLIESDTTVPVAVEPSGTLQKGSFLYTAGSGGDMRRIRYYDLATGGNSFVIDGDERMEHIPVIVLTSDKNEAVKVTALNLGANDFLIKPVRSSELWRRCHWIDVSKC